MTASAKYLVVYWQDNVVSDCAGIPTGNWCVYWFGNSLAHAKSAFKECGYYHGKTELIKTDCIQVKDAMPERYRGSKGVAL